MKTNAFIHYSVIHGFFWMAYCAGTGFSSTYLLNIGFSNGEIGILVAAAGLCAAFLQPTLATRIDLSGKRLLKPVLYGCILAAVGLSALLLMLPAGYRLAGGICFGGNLCVLQLMIPLINSLSICGRDSENINFGFSRAIGSLTYAAISYALGRMIAAVGMEMLARARIICFAGLLCSLFFFPVLFQEKQKIRMDVKKGKNMQAHFAGREQPSGTGGKEAFFYRNPGFLTMMAGCFLLYLCHSFLTYYNYQIVLSKGGSEQTYGVVIALAAMLELPVMFGFSAMLKKAPAALWFQLSGLGYICKAVGCLLAPGMMTYYGVQIFQMAAWAMISVASVSFVKEVTAPGDSTRGQAFVTLSYTTAMAMGSLSGGFLLQLMSVRMMLLCAIIFACSGSLVLSFGIRKIHKSVKYAD